LTDDNSNPVDMDNLENFNKAFFGNEPDTEEQEVPQEEDLEEEIEEESHENEDDDSLATDDDEDVDEQEDDEDEEPQPKAKKRNRTQERIEKLVTEARQAERDRDALRRQLDEVLASIKKEEKTEDEPAFKDKLVPEAPQPDAVDKDGEPLYPLGEFDPKYIADLTRFTITQEMEATRKVQEEKQRQREIETQQEALKASWEENLERAEEAIPDIRENIATMADAFEGIDPNYGEYLAGTIMSCEYGPEIMYYLSQNIGEAQKIVASGPAAATLAIGRLEAKFMTKPEDAKRNSKKVSDAPPPPNARSRGSGGRFAVPADTRDLAAFRREFYKE
jgi:hypothetical protein